MSRNGGGRGQGAHDPGRRPVSEFSAIAGYAPFSRSSLVGPSHLVARIGLLVGDGVLGVVGEWLLADPRMPALPFKAEADRAVTSPEQKHRVTNWPAYDAGLRQRGSLTVWFTDEAIAAWRLNHAPPGAVSRVLEPWLS